MLFHLEIFYHILREFTHLDHMRHKIFFALTILVCLQKNLFLALLLATKDRCPSWWMETRTQGSLGEKNTFMFIYIQNTYDSYPSMKLRLSRASLTSENRRGPHLPPIPSVSGSIPVSSQEGPSTETLLLGLRISSSWRRSRAATARLSACLFEESLSLWISQNKIR